MKLIIDKITKSYGTNKALDSFSAELDTGVYALLGPNGSGKSTLMNILTDNLDSDSGDIFCEYDGKRENTREMGRNSAKRLVLCRNIPDFTRISPLKNSCATWLL